MAHRLLTLSYVNDDETDGPDIVVALSDMLKEGIYSMLFIYLLMLRSLLKEIFFWPNFTNSPYPNFNMTLVYFDSSR